ncbi:hypothetical protein GGR22_002917 [Flavobacterium gossypii]|uniref:DUF1287 domain-containing protein n=2 Tax=Flavobacterium TaxID=237 RepID=A0A495M7B9_9FLAO|nr:MULTISPECIES: DUF1287 domain-containing protein [Flavobacterium]MBA9074744.1 hypothetical protein [Flavobacterium gossypii]RKS21924.1 hypothetical protein CLV94_2559 [Flavobacterium endophyticum]WDO14380.1 DUF1287 domain-containing protein [Flavobacterium sp. WW92]
MKYFYPLALLLFCSITVEKTFSERLSDAAITLTKDKVTYDSSYFSIKYPNGDVPKDKGVCTDVVIRAYRKLGIDLQKEVHEDMKQNFSKYPKNWGLKNTDTNIDHRRVPNLQVFFTRFGKSLKVTDAAADYKTGDLVTWMIGERMPHIGIVTNRKTSDGKRNLIVHNVGAGQVLEDCLFKYKITGHYQFKK